MPNPLDDIVDGIIGDTNLVAANSLIRQKRDPVRMGRARKLAAKYGIASPLIEAQPEVFEARDRKDTAEIVLEQHPWMGTMLAADPDVGKMMGDRDMEKTGNLVAAFGMSQPTEKYTLGMQGKGIGNHRVGTRAALPPPPPSYGKRVVKTAGAIYGTTVNNIIGAVAGAAENVTDLTPLADKLDPFYREFEEAGRQANENLMSEVSGWITPGTKQGVFSGVVSINTMGAAALSGAGAVLPLLTGMTYGSAYQKYQGRGNNVGMSMLGSGIEAAVEWATERGPLGFLTRGMKGSAKDFLTQYVLGDYAGEQIATGLQSLTEEAIKPNGPERTLKDWLLDPQRGRDAWETLVATTVMVGAVGGTGAAMRRMAKTSDQMVDTTDGLIGQQILDQAMERAADNIELKNNSPEDWAKFINAGAANTPVKNVYIPIEAIEAALADETLPEEERAALTFYQDQIEEARLNQSEMVIPIGDALASFAGTKVWQSLKDDARVLAGGISGREARENTTKLIEELEAVGNQAIEEARAAAPATKAKAGVYNEVKAMMIASGRSTKEAQDTAAVYASRAENLASERYGQFKTVDDAWKWMQLSIVGPDAKVGKGKKVAQPPVQSKIVDDEGKHLRVYHTTTAAFDEYRSGTGEGQGGNTLGTGIYFTADPSFADDMAKETYAEAKAAGRGFKKGYVEGANIRPAYLELRNPYFHKPGDPVGAELEKKAKAAGHDGIVFSTEGSQKSIHQRFREIVVFDPKSILSQRPSSPFAKENLLQLLERDDWALLTAANPMAKQLSAEENANLNEDLKATLDAMGLTYTPTRGKYDNEEPSFAVEGITEEQALMLGRRFNQDSVLTHKGYVFQDGSSNPATGVRILDKDADNYFTELPDGTKFAIDIDFDTRVPAESDAAWTSERIAGMIKQFGNPDGSSQAVAVMMSPDQFLGLTASETGRELVSKRVAEMDKYGQLDVAKLLADGPITLTVSRADEPSNVQKGMGIERLDDQVMGHDGRHRMEMLKAAGVQNVPVVVVIQDGKKKPLPTEPVTMRLNAQRSRSDQLANGDIDAFDVDGIPISSRFTEQLEAMSAGTTLFQGPLLDNEQASSIQGSLEVARGQKFPNQRDFKLAVQKLVNAYKGNKRKRERLIRLALNDARVALQNNSNAVGWYDEKVEQALAVFATIHPEIDNDVDARFAFIYALAVTSNGLKVDANFELADKVYREWQSSGSFPLRGEGTAAKAMENSLHLFNTLTQQFGFDGLLELMLRRDVTVKEVEQLTGVKVSGEHKGTVVTGAAFLGPKIGNGFFSNLYGNFDQLTMDRWFIRTWGRWTGTLITQDKVKIKEKRGKVKALLQSLTPEEITAAEKALKYKINLKDIDGFAKRVNAMTVKADVREKLNAIHPRLRLDPKALYGLLDGQKEAPQGPNERNEIRSIMQPVLAELQRDNPELTMADLQAVLWYPEKTLYATATAGGETATGYEDDEAPDYANAAVALARYEGIPQETIDAALEAASQRVSDRAYAANSARRAGRSSDVPGFAEDQDGFPAEDVLVSDGDGTTDPTSFKQGPRGEATFYPSGKTVVQLFAKADFSTMLHETAHVFLQQEFTLAKHPNASAELKADVAALTKWMIANGGALDENGMPNREAHELFARTGERYFREGKAPSAELRPAFSQFKSWLTSVYKSIKGIGKAPITPEIREIMDRMIATEDAIEANATQPMSQEDLGMSEAEYGAYLDSVKTARDTAHDTLLERMMKAIRNRNNKEMREQRANVRAAIAEEVNARPEFIALHLLRTGRWLGDPSRERTPVKISTGWLLDNYGDEILGQLPVGLQPLHHGEGVVGDEIADLVGMPSGDALIRALIDLKAQAAALKADGNPRPLRDQIIEDLLNEEMSERHGDIAMSEEEIEEEAIAALNANRQGEVLATELRQLKKRGGQGVVTPYALLREWARRKANEGIVSEVASKSVLQRYIRAYNKARTAFENALLDKKPDEAIKQKQAQMINHALLAEGKVVADEINTIVKRMQRYARTKALASIDQDYMDRIHELLEGYNFRDVTDAARAEKASFEEWAAAQTLAGQEVHVPPRFRDDRTNWKDAQVSKLLELNDMVQSLVAVGKLKQKLINAQGERDLAETIDDTESRILNLSPRRLPESSTGQESKPFMQSVREGDYRAAVGNLLRPGGRVRDLAAGLIKIEGLFDILDGTKDGTGPLNQNVVRGATEAQNTFSKLMEEVMEPIISRYKGFSRKQSARLRDFVTINELTLNVSIHEADTEKLGQPLTIPRMKLIGLLLNTGNLSNLQKLVAGERWGDSESATDLERVRDILVSYASKEDLDLVQDIWNGVGKLWPHITKVERELSGIVPEAVVPTEFDTPFGTYTGGYWPVVWDSTRSKMGQQQGEEAETSLQGVGFGIATPKGHTITRTGAAAPMEWSMEAVLFGHMTKVISRIAYAPWVRDTLKIVDNSRVTGAIRLRLGNEYVAAIKPWMRDQIPSNMPDVQGAKSWEKLLNQVRINMSISVLGVSYSTGMAQALGLGYSAGVLGDGNVVAGGKWVALGIGKMLQMFKDGRTGPQEFVFARSEEMKRRAHEVNQESTEVFRRLRDDDTLVRKLQAGAFWHIGFIDLNMVAIPTWMGGYHKALSQGLSETDAAAYGDKMVRLSQSSGRKKDLSAIQRGNAGQKFIAMFYTPSSVFFNQQWEAAQHLKAGNWNKALAPTFWFLVMTSIAEAMQTGDWPEDDEEDGLGGMDIAEWVGRNLMFGAFYGYPIARDISNTTERQMRGEYAEYGTTPLSFAAQTIGRGIKTGQKIVEGEETTGKDLKAGVAAMGFLLGLPGNQVGKTSGFVKDVYDGNVEPDGAYDWYRGLTSGKPPEGQEQ